MGMGYEQKNYLQVFHSFTIYYTPDEVKNKKILTIKYIVNVQGIWNSKLLYEGTAIWMGVYYQSVGFEQKEYL